MITPLSFKDLAIRGVRNLQPAQVSFSPALNVLFGDNGQGKTSLLEAICVSATTRSFRTEQIREVVQQGTDALLVSANVNDDGLTRQQRVVVGPHSRQAFINDKRISALASYAMHSPIVVFSPNDLDLVTGSANMRRSLLDRIALYSDPSTQDCRLAYSRALRHRQHLLDQSGRDAKALLAFESILAEQGLQYGRAHSMAAARLCQYLPATFAALCSQSLSLEACFSGTPTAEPEVFRRELFERRVIDKHSRRASWGPHRDDLSLSIDRKTARHHASQGQQRLLALALKLAEFKCIQAVRQTHPVLLLDDVSSELDQNRTSSVFDWLRSTESQVFLTSPRDDLLDGLEISQKEQRHFKVDNGEIRHLPY